MLRYHGGKWRLAPWIIAHFPAHRVYVEPFGGAASVLMRKPRSHAEVLNDLDGEVVNVFRQLRDERAAGRLLDLLRLTPFSRAEYEASHEPSDCAVESARRTLVKAWMGFGSGAISHRHAGFRVAASERRHTAAEWARYAEVIPHFTARLSGVFVEQRPALDVIARFDAPDALHFIDPPYVTSTRGPRHRYRHEMTDTAHGELARALRHASGMVVVCGYPSDLYSSLYDGWHVRTKQSRDALSNERTEVLWLNDACAGALALRGAA